MKPRLCIPRSLLLAGFLCMGGGLLMSCYVVVVWSGRYAHGLTLAEAEQAVADGRNPAAATTRIGDITVRGIDDLLLISEREDDAGMVARRALCIIRERLKP